MKKNPGGNAEWMSEEIPGDVSTESPGEFVKEFQDYSNSKKKPQITEGGWENIP